MNFDSSWASVIGFRLLPIACSMIFFEATAVLECDRHSHLVFGDRAVRNCRDAVSKSSDGGVAHCGIAELRLGDLAGDDGRGDGMVNTELTFETRPGLLLSGELEHERVDAQFDGSDVLRGEMVFRPELETSVNRGMYDHSARKRLVAVGGDLEVLAEPLGDLGIVVRRAQDVRPAAQALPEADRNWCSSVARAAPGNPFCAARPGWKLLVMVPNISRKPTGCTAARPRAQTIAAHETQELPIAAAAPKGPTVPVMCHPTS